MKIIGHRTSPYRNLNYESFVSSLQRAERSKNPATVVHVIIWNPNGLPSPLPPRPQEIHL